MVVVAAAVVAGRRVGGGLEGAGQLLRRHAVGHVPSIPYKRYAIHRFLVMIEIWDWGRGGEGEGNIRLRTRKPLEE